MKSYINIIWSMKQSYIAPIAPITHLNNHISPQYIHPIQTTEQYNTIPAQLVQSRYTPYPPQYNSNPYYKYNSIQQQQLPQYQVSYEPQSLQNSMIRNQSNKWNINQSNQANVNNFPFGKDRAEIYKYVSEKMQTSIDEENKRIIEKFRIDAIKNRNQRVMKHLGKIPYVSESMMPGTSIDASRFVQKPSVKPKVLQPQPQYNYIPTTQVYTAPVQKQVSYPIIKTPRRQSQPSHSIGIEVNFEQQFPLKTKKKNKKGYYTIEQQEQEKAMGKIEDMLHQINVKLKKNTELLSKSTADNIPISQSRVLPEMTQSRSISRSNYFKQNPDRDDITKLPQIKYSVSYIPRKNRSRTMANEDGESSDKCLNLKDHLKLIKKNRRRLEDLDQYVYS